VRSTKHPLDSMTVVEIAVDDLTGPEIIESREAREDA
jgi:hypothetical protein